MDSPVKVYFASDFHLGAPNLDSSLKREKIIVEWLNKIKIDATEIFLVGDVFDFWFTYKKVIPKGFTRLLGKLAEIVDSGIPIHFFSGNHDLWGLEYFQKELGLHIHYKPILKTWGNQTLYIGHGDGLGPGDYTYKQLKKGLFLNPFAQWAFAHLHPDFGIWLAQSWSSKSRLYGQDKEGFLGNENEWLVQFCLEEIALRKSRGEIPVNYFIFGHRHLSLDIALNENSRYINLGEWINSKTYGLFDGRNFELIPLDIINNQIIRN